MNSKYIHKIDKSKIPTCDIMGVKIAAINMAWLLEFTQKNIKKLSGDYICVANVHTTVTAYEEEDYREIQNEGIMAIPDGGPLSSIGNKRGFCTMARTPGPSYMEAVMNMSVQNGWRHFFYGSTDDTLGKLRGRLEETFPGVQIVGMCSPPFRELTEIENIEIINKINKAEPDFVWVGLGAPKQERWMSEHQGKIKGLMVGVGAGFDYLTGNINRAPKWMQEHNLEWLFRLMQEPRRLFYRYWHTNLQFIWHACLKGE